MTQNINEIEINGIKYVPKDSVSTSASAISTEGLPYVIIRTYSAGVHAGYLQKRESTAAGIEVTLIHSRRLWQWAGAASLSQMAMEGTSKPESCKFPCEVSSIDLVAIEIIPCTEKAMNSIKNVKIWQA